jgi:PAS domain S-box-containing protein
MPENSTDSHTHGLQSRVAVLEELLAALERTVVEQSERLEQSAAAQAHLVAIIQSADAAIIGLSLDFRIQSWNIAAERLFGYSAPEAIGRRPDELFAESADLEHASSQFFTDIKSFRQPEASAHYFETRLRRRDGSTLEASFIASGIYDSNRRLAGVSIIVRDVSEQKSRERALARLAAIVESSDDAITGIDADGRVTSWNRGAENLLRLSAAQAIGQPLE